MRPLALKIIVLTALLTAALGAAVGFAVHSVRLGAGLSEAERAVAVQRSATDRLMNALVAASTLAEGATLRYADDSVVACYLKGVERTDSALAALRQSVADSAQRERLDTLRELISQRSQSVMSLIDALRKENGKGSPLQQQIAALRSGRRPFKVATEVKPEVVERGEEVVIHSRKRGFFRRLGDAFRRGGKDDTVSVRTVTREHPAEHTARAQINIADTLADILTDVHRHVTASERQGNRRIARHSDALRLTSQRLSRRIAETMNAFSTAQAAQITRATARDLADRRRAAWQMGLLALISTGAALALFVWVWRDMRQAHRYRQALEAANERTEALMKRREQLLLTISHDIKAPVNTILGYLALIPTAPGGRSDAQTEALGAIDASAHHLMELVTALLDYHKLEAGEVKVKREAVDVGAMLAEVVQAFRPLATHKGLALNYDRPDLAGRYLTDGFHLRQIVENLLSNAIKYTAHGSVTLAARETGGRLSVSVSDTGCGLSAADRQRIFAPFTRVKGSEGQEGTGLGLSITRQLARLLGGEISVESELGRGSTFTLTLPADHAANGSVENGEQPAGMTSGPEVESGAQPVTGTVGQEPARGATASDQHNAPCALGEKAYAPDNEETEGNEFHTSAPATDNGTRPPLIYVLDDDRLQLRLTEAMLHNVAPASTDIVTFGEAGEMFRCLQAGKCPVLIFTDIEMPGLTGFEVRERIHAMPGCEDLPVVAMTSHTLLPADHFTDRGFARVLFKPFTQNDLREALRLGEGTARPSCDDNAATGTEEPDTASPFSPLLTFAMGDAEAERQILEQFLTDCRHHAERLAGALDRHDKATLCQTAHKMLPTFTLIHSSAVEALTRLEARRGETGWNEADTADARAALDEAQRVADQLDRTLRQ